MKINCNIIKDLLPSYIDGLTSNESNKLIEMHLENCKECESLYNSMKQDVPVIEDSEKTISDQAEIKLMKKIRTKFITVVSTLMITFLIIGIAVGAYGNVLFKEGNPIPLIKSISKLEATNAEYVKFSEMPIKNISKSNIDRENLIKEYMKEKGWTYKEQMGNSYFFNKDGEEAIVKTSQFTRRYFIWEVPAESTLETE